MRYNCIGIRSINVQQSPANLQDLPVSNKISAIRAGLNFNTKCLLRQAGLTQKQFCKTLHTRLSNYCRISIHFSVPLMILSKDSLSHANTERNEIRRIQSNISACSWSCILHCNDNNSGAGIYIPSSEVSISAPLGNHMFVIQTKHPVSRF